MHIVAQMSDQTTSISQAIGAVKELRWGRLWSLLSVPVVAVLVVWSLNYMLIGRPVERKLGADLRNRGYSLCAHYRFYIDTSTLVLDLRSLESAAPVDLFRALFQSAEALNESGRTFEMVVLARSGTAVFLMKGDDFRATGAEFSGGQNPVYLIRTLPEKLLQPSGVAAFHSWEGGLLGVLGKQMEDANEAARQWAGADLPTAS